VGDQVGVILGIAVHEGSVEKLGASVRELLGTVEKT